jgi:hypothetical protein
MSSSRRDFLKTSVIAGTGMAIARHAYAGSIAHADDPALLAGMLASPAQSGMKEASNLSFTCGIGIYPGAPSEDFSPEFVRDTSGTYRNLALLRPAFHSSSYDYNLTAQLVTDGISDTRVPESYPRNQNNP